MCTGEEEKREAGRRERRGGREEVKEFLSNTIITLTSNKRDFTKKLLGQNNRGLEGC